MTFTYLGTLTTDLDKVRMYTGDTSNAPDAGVKPGGYNFHDAELNGIITAEGSWQRAVAGVYEILAALFAQEVDEKNEKISTMYSQKAARYQAMAKQWRDKYGMSSGGGTVTTSAVTRIDGYSEDVAANEL